MCCLSMHFGQITSVRNFRTFIVNIKKQNSVIKNYNKKRDIFQRALLTLHSHLHILRKKIQWKIQMTTKIVIALKGFE